MENLVRDTYGEPPEKPPEVNIPYQVLVPLKISGDFPVPDVLKFKIDIKVRDPNIRAKIISLTSDIAHPTLSRKSILVVCPIMQHHTSKRSSKKSKKGIFYWFPL